MRQYSTVGLFVATFFRSTPPRRTVKSSKSHRYLKAIMIDYIDFFSISNIWSSSLCYNSDKYRTRVPVVTSGYVWSRVKNTSFYTGLNSCFVKYRHRVMLVITAGWKGPFRLITVYAVQLTSLKGLRSVTVRLVLMCLMAWALTFQQLDLSYCIQGRPLRHLVFVSPSPVV